MTNIPSHVGAFRVKKVLTEKLNYGDWLIYRDPVNGIYLYNVTTHDEINPLFWNITIGGWSEKIREILISDIQKFERGEHC